jgi:RNA polymerase sigma-70 factor (ECF subfamily)
MNLSRDHLRRRQRRRYIGPWLPAPIETARHGVLPDPGSAEADAAAADPHELRSSEPGAERRYDWAETSSYAFLIAAEALTPLQRAVLLLRDLLEYSAQETADALGTSEGSVRTTLHRARRALALHRERHAVPTPELRERTRTLLGAFLRCLAQGDAAGIESLLTEDVVVLNDAAGRYAAARVPVRGRARVARFHIKVRGTVLRAELRELNGLPALVAERSPDALPPHIAPRFVLLVLPDASGERIRGLCSLMAPAKLRGVAAVP